VRQSVATVARRATSATARTPSKSPGEAAGEAGFDHVDAEPLELLCDLCFLFWPQGDARRLLAVSECRIEDLDPARTHYNLLSRAR